MSYGAEFIGYLKRHNLRTFTHKDIILQTDTNCPYSVLQAVRAKLEKEGQTVTEMWEKENNKPHKRYWIEAIA